MTMCVTLLGVGEAFDPNEANSAALVEAEGFTLLIDCGHSAVGPLWRARPGPDAVDAVYLTHHHADHVLGLVPVLDRWASEERRAPFTIVTTAWGIGQLRQVFSLTGVATVPFPVTYQVSGDTERIGPFAVAVAPTVHSMPNHAVRLEAGGRRLAYSGDGRPTAESRALFADVDLLLHECFEAEASESRFHCDLPTVRGIDGPARIGLYHVRAGQRGAMRAALKRATPKPGERLFVPEAGDVLAV